MSKAPDRQAQTFFVETRFQRMARRPGGVRREQALENAQANLEESKPEFEYSGCVWPSLKRPHSARFSDSQPLGF